MQSRAVHRALLLEGYLVAHVLGRRGAVRDFVAIQPVLELLGALDHAVAFTGDQIHALERRGVLLPVSYTHLTLPTSDLV